METGDESTPYMYGVEMAVVNTGEIDDDDDFDVDCAGADAAAGAAAGGPVAPTNTTDHTPTPVVRGSTDGDVVGNIMRDRIRLAEDSAATATRSGSTTWLDQPDPFVLMNPLPTMQVFSSAEENGNTPDRIRLGSRVEKEERKRSHRALPVSTDDAIRMPRTCAVSAIDGAPALSWEDIALLVQGLPSPIVAEGAREHIMSGWRSPRRVFVERLATRRKPGGDRWLNSGGKKGSLVYWIRPQLGICKRYGKCEAVDPKMSDLPLRFAQFTLISGTSDKPVWKSGGPAVFVLHVVRQEDLRASRTDAQEKEVCASQVGAPSASQVLEGSHGSAAVMDLVQRHGKKFISFRTADDDGKSIELGAIEKGGNGITMSSSQGDFAEWHPRVKMEPHFCEGDVVGFTPRGEITRLCSVSGRMLLGVISRKAIVAGSAPPMAERDLYDTVAYCGRVPVRVVPRSADDRLPGISVQSVCTTRCGSE